MTTRKRIGQTFAHWPSLNATSLVIASAFGLLACNNVGEDVEELANSRSALTQGESTTPNCGYEVKGDAYGTWPNGFKAYVELHNVSGVAGTAFEVLADLGGATVTQSYNAPMEADGDWFSFTEPSWLRWQQIPQGRTYRFGFIGAGQFTGITPYLISVNGNACDVTAPSVSLKGSQGLFTSGGTLTLTANATDDVAVRKVVFTRDGMVIGTDSKAPFTLDVPVSADDNGRHVYAATAYDPSGNRGVSNDVRLLSAIGNKFFGTAVDTAADYADVLTYFNQITPGNAGKWGSVEATRDVMDFTKLDQAYAYARTNGLRFKLHTLVWGQQQPAWLSTLSVEEQLTEIDEWMAALAARYPDADLVDVVNEPLHAKPSYTAALGGDGDTGWDWVVTAFTMARKYFPRAELLLNDYNILILDDATSQYRQIVSLLQDRGLVDGIGLQSHFLERAELATLKGNLDRLATTGLPIYVSELDVDFANDARQAVRMSELFPLFWEHSSVVGVTHWGHLQGNMWRTNAYLLYSNHTPRPAMTWLTCYLAGNTDCALPEYIPEARTGDTSGITLEGEDYDEAQGIIALGSAASYVDAGDWESFRRVTFNSNWTNLSVTYTKGNDAAANVSVYLDGLDTTPIATINLPSTGSWSKSSTITIPWAPISGEHDVYLEFGGTYGVGNIDNIAFFAPNGLGPNLISNGEFESSTNGWFTWNGTLSTTAERAFTGTQSLRLSGRTGNGPIATNVASLVNAGVSYQVSFWVAVSGTDPSSVNLTQKLVCDGVTTYARLVNSTTVAAGSWVELTGTLTIPTCTSLSELLIYAEGPAAGVDLYVDHVSLRAPSTANLLGNGTFETGTSGWYTWNGNVSTTNTRAHGGSQSLLVGTRTGNAPAATDVTNLVSAGSNYKLTFWVSVSGTPSADVNLTRKVVCDGVTSYSWVVSPTAVTEGAWVELSGVLSIPTCTTLSSVTVYAEGPPAGVDLYVDDVSLSK